LWTVGLAGVLLLGGVTVRVGRLQTADRDTYATYGERQRLRAVTLPAARGVIFDRNGFELALSAPQTTFWADPRLVEGDPATVQALAQALGLDAEETAALAARLRDRLGTEDDPEVEFVYVARQVDDETATKLEALDLEGISSYVEPKRFFPAGDVARGVLGAVNTDGIGSAGLEKLFDPVLQGTPGELMRERDAQGRSIPSGRRILVPAKPGSDLVLTIDKTLQYATEEALKRQVLESRGRGAMAVVMDTQTGDILAMASIRTDPETGIPEVASANLAMVEAHEPGSVAKIITAAAALQEGVMTGSSRIPVPYSKKFYDVEFKDVHPHATEEYDIEDIIAYSSNIGTMLLAQGLGPAKLESYLRAFGLGSRTPIDFPGETAGILPPSAKWRGTEKLTPSFGQGLAFTAVQLVAAVNVVANGGTYVAPRLVKATIDPEGNQSDAVPSETRQVLSPEVAAEMNRVLRAVVCRGTGRRAAIPGYAVAGKTGTAYKAQEGGGYLDAEGRRHYFASFAGYAPAENPRFSVVVSIDEPQGDHYGGLVAAPPFVDIAQEVVRELKIPPSPSGGACPQVDKGGE
jgi:cell division protein FtsI (penicillin-binding protein 3)